MTPFVALMMQINIRVTQCQYKLFFCETNTSGNLRPNYVVCRKGSLKQEIQRKDAVSVNLRPKLSRQRNISAIKNTLLRAFYSFE